MSDDRDQHDAFSKRSTTTHLRRSKQASKIVSRLASEFENDSESRYKDTLGVFQNNYNVFVHIMT